MKSSAVPHHYRSRAIIAFRNLPFEVGVALRMIFRLHRQPLVGVALGRSFGHSPRLQRPIDRQPEIVVQPRCPVLLNHEGVAMLGPGTDLQLWQFRLWQARVFGARGGLVLDLTGKGFRLADGSGVRSKRRFRWYSPSLAMKTFYPRLFRVPGPPSPMQTNIKLTNKPPAQPTIRLASPLGGRLILKARAQSQACCRRSVPMATTVWKGHLTFGLISMPVRMTTAARGERISFNQLHKECHSRLKQPLFCPVCNRNVERSEIVKGYEYEKDQYVLFSEEELDKIEPSSARVMEILEFVKLDDMDPLYFDSSYYITPEDAGVKAYQLLMKAMEESGY